MHGDRREDLVDAEANRDWYGIFLHFALEAKEGGLFSLSREMIRARVAFYLDVESGSADSEVVLPARLVRAWTNRLEQEDPSFVGFFSDEDIDS